MRTKGWKKIRNEKDYKVWDKNGKRVAVYRGIFTTPSRRSYRERNMAAGVKRAKIYMRKKK